MDFIVPIARMTLNQNSLGNCGTLQHAGRPVTRWNASPEATTNHYLLFQRNSHIHTFTQNWRSMSNAAQNLILTESKAATMTTHFPARQS
jgi:hypothetical protein